jgi:hypothetical protein
LMCTQDPLLIDWIDESQYTVISTGCWAPYIRLECILYERNQEPGRVYELGWICLTTWSAQAPLGFVFFSISHWSCLETG